MGSLIFQEIHNKKNSLYKFLTTGGLIAKWQKEFGNARWL
jgi:hypothetical protein